MAATSDSILKDLKNRKFSPIYLLQGEEPFFIDEISDYIEENILSEAEKGFNQTILYGKDSTAEQIVSQARRFPMMSELQVVIVKEFQTLPDLRREEGQNLLLSYAKNPSPQTILVLCHKNKTLDKRTQFGKTFNKLVLGFTSKKTSDRSIPQWIQDYVKARGAKINRDALLLLSEYIGNNLSRLSNEIDKILINSSGKNETTEINKDLIQKYIGISKEFNIFELQKALIYADVNKIFYIVKYFESNPKVNPPVLTLTMLYSFYSKLLIAATALRSSKNIVREAGIPPFLENDYREGARRYGYARLVRSISFLREADGKVKGIENANTPPEKVITELIYKLLSLTQKK